MVKGEEEIAEYRNGAGSRGVWYHIVASGKDEGLIFKFSKEKGAHIFQTERTRDTAKMQVF
jgi:hypothetical protein